MMRGVIAIVDALGVQTYSLEQSRRFIEIRNKIVSQILSMSVETSKRISQKNITPNIYTFGDTIIFSWKDEDDKPKSFIGTVWIGTWLRYLMILGLQNKLLFRGALSYGDYISEESTILGPAVADAVSWYEAADWFGIICAPSMQFLLNSAESRLTEDDEKNIMPAWFMKYDVPIKNERRKELWTVPWPYDIWSNNFDPALDSKDVKMNAVGHINILLNGLLVPRGTEDKYFNSLAYFNHCIDKYSSIEGDIHEPNVFDSLKNLPSTKDS